MSSVLLCPSCHRRLKVADTAGAPVLCPACGATVPATRDAIAAERAPGRSPPAREKQGDAPAVPPPAGKRSSSKPMVALVVGLGCGVALLLGAVGAGVGLFVYVRHHRTIPAAEWARFSPPGGGCSILMPGAPVRQPMTVNGVTVNKYVVERKDGVFVIGFIDLPAGPIKPGALEVMAVAERDHMLRQTNGRLANESRVQLGALPGREFTLAVPGRGTLVSRVYLGRVGGANRAYIVTAGGDSLRPGAGDAERFFGSFQVEGSAGPAGAGQPSALGPQPPPAPRGGPRKLWQETSGTQTIALAFAPDSATLAVGHWNSQLRLYEPAADRVRATVPTDGTGPVFALAFSPDGKQLVTTGGAGWVVLRDAATGQEQRRFQALHSQAKERHHAPAVAFTPDGKALALGLYTGDHRQNEVQLRDPGADKPKAVLPDAGGPIKGLTFTAAGALVVQMDHAVKVLDPATLQVRRELKGAGPGEFITSAVSPDGQTLATLGADRQLKVWRLGSGECLHTWPVQPDVIAQSYFPMRYSPDGKVLALGARGPRVYLYDAATGKELSKVPAGNNGFVDVLAISPDGKYLALHGSDGPRVLDLAPLLAGAAAAK